MSLIISKDYSLCGSGNVFQSIDPTLPQNFYLHQGHTIECVHSLPQLIKATDPFFALYCEKFTSLF